MPAERVSMRRVREILRLKFECGRSDRAIAVAVSVARSTDAMIPIGYRPRKSALEAISVTRRRCWDYDWVVEFDIRGLFNNLRS